MHYISGRLEIWVESAAQFNSLVEILLLQKKKKKKKKNLKSDLGKF
jgi:hypothetical protein